MLLGPKKEKGAVGFEKGKGVVGRLAGWHNVVSSPVFHWLPFKAFQIIQNSEFRIFLGKTRIALYSWETY